MKSIFIIGAVKGAYRSQNLIKVLIDNNYKIFYNSLLDKKFSKKSIKSIIDLIFLPYKLFFLLFSDVVLVCAMNNNRYLEIILAIIFKKKIFVDFYISNYETRVFDHKVLNKKSLRAKFLFFF